MFNLPLQAKLNLIQQKTIALYVLALALTEDWIMHGGGGGLPLE